MSGIWNAFEVFMVLMCAKSVLKFKIMRSFVYENKIL